MIRWVSTLENYKYRPSLCSRWAHLKIMSMCFCNKISGSSQVIVHRRNNGVLPWSNSKHIVSYILKITIWSNFPVWLHIKQMNHKCILVNRFSYNKDSTFNGYSYRRKETDIRLILWVRKEERKKAGPDWCLELELWHHQSEKSLGNLSCSMHISGKLEQRTVWILVALTNPLTNIHLYTRISATSPQTCPQTSFHQPTWPATSRIFILRIWGMKENCIWYWTEKRKKELKIIVTRQGHQSWITFLQVPA